MGCRNSIIKQEMKCLICWEDFQNKNIYVKCHKCKIYIHDNCAYSYYINNVNLYYIIIIMRIVIYYDILFFFIKFVKKN